MPPRCGSLSRRLRAGSLLNSSGASASDSGDWPLRNKAHEERCARRDSNPRPPAWKAGTLTAELLTHAGSVCGGSHSARRRYFLWSRWRESTPRPPAYKAAALASELHRQNKNSGRLASTGVIILMCLSSANGRSSVDIMSSVGRSICAFAQTHAPLNHYAACRSTQNFRELHIRSLCETEFAWSNLIGWSTVIEAAGIGCGGCPVVRTIGALTAPTMHNHERHRTHPDQEKGTRQAAVSQHPEHRHLGWQADDSLHPDHAPLLPLRIRRCAGGDPQTLPGGRGSGVTPVTQN